MAGIKAIGSKLSVNTGTSQAPTWTQIANLTTIGEIGLESDEIDVTTLDSADDFKEYIGGAKDGGNVSLEGNIVTDAGLTQLYTLANSRAVKQFKVEYPKKPGESTAAYWTITGYISSCKDGEKTVDGLLTFSAGIRVSGAPTFTAGVPASA